MRRVILILCLCLVSCAAKPKFYETKVTLKSIEVVSRDTKTNAPQLIEVQVEYPSCPGDQLETLQGNVEFTQCAQKFKVGDTLPASVEWGPTDYGHYDSEIIKLGDCVRKRDLRDARSYEVVQSCVDVNVNGVKAGFHCDRKPTAELLTACPWFARK
jgi:hypothetical protein